MPDEIDRLQELRDIENDNLVRTATRAEIPAGEPGECQHCGEHSPRLVNTSCAPCRDELGLP